MKKLLAVYLFISFISGIYGQIPSSGLISWYPFNNNLLDSTSNNNDLAPVFSNGGLNYVSGINGMALNFAQGGNCDIPQVANLTGLNNNSFTIAGWFNLQDSLNSTSVGLAVGRNAITNFPTFSLEYFNSGSTGEIQFYTYYDFTYSNYQLSSFDITSELNEWHHFAFSYEGGDSIKAYIDGYFMPAFSIPTTSDTLNDITSRLDFGANLSYCNVQGSSDEILIYDRALSEAEINQIFNSSTMSITEQKGSQFSIFPNPANDIINIQLLNGETLSQIEILNIDGKMIKSIHPTQNSVDISNLHSGIYLVRCNINHTWYVQRIVKN